MQRVPSRHDEHIIERKCACGRSLMDCVTPDCITDERAARNPQEGLMFRIGPGAPPVFIPKSGY